MKKQWVAAALGLGIALLGTHVEAATLVVPDDFATVQAAIDAANSGDRVSVRPGIYSGPIDFLGKDVEVVATDGPAVTVLQISGEGPIVTIASGETRTALLEGFTLTGAIGEGDGGGLYINAGPTIRGNIIRDNQACIGAGARVEGSGYPRFEDNRILDNENLCTGPGAGGAGVRSFGAVVEIVGNEFRGNRTGAGSEGAAVKLNIGQDSLIEKNLFVENFADGGSGGALALVNSTTTLITQNIFVGNEAVSGGALYWTAGPVQATMTNNTLIDNRAGSGSAFAIGGRVDHTRWVNNVLAAGSGTSLIHCGSVLQILPELIHNILHAEGAPIVAGDCEEQPSSTGNLMAPPMLRSDFSPLPASPLVDAGLADPLGVSGTDFYGQPRVVDGDLDGTPRIDIGAVERQPDSVEVPALEVWGLLALAAGLGALGAARARRQAGLSGRT
ncbi:MAG: right-handed parallel beta-helix repeat-containing protein [Acidobacteriota bacterium]|nr:right-handed parallel beta-helix repeat-containing protein [Acidobacteriota bacterium]